MLNIHQFPYGSDNYGVLLHCPESSETTMIDAGDAAAAETALAETGWRIKPDLDHASSWRSHRWPGRNQGRPWGRMSSDRLPEGRDHRH